MSEAAAEALRCAIEFEGPETVAGFIAEPVQGAGGVIVPPEDYLRRCRDICDEYDVLFIADEVITGFGRTGTWFGCRTYGVQPDIMCFAKGLTSGYIPMGATLCREGIYDAYLGKSPPRGSSGMVTPKRARHGGRCGARQPEDHRGRGPSRERREGWVPLCPRPAFARRHPIVGDVRGVGLLARVELVEDRKTRKPFEKPGTIGGRVQRRVHDLGVIFRNVGDVLTFSPPLILTAMQADEIVTALDTAIGEVCDSL